MTSSPDGGLPSPVSQGRQRRGAACEECRRRKLRCDGVQPQCGVCVEAGVVCEVNAHRALRGPKKGYLKALKNRVAFLESRLATQQTTEPSLGTNPLPTPVTDLTTEATISGLGDFNHDSLLPTRSASVSESDIRQSGVGALSGPLGNPNQHVSELMQAELDQLYFDRVHASLCILNQRRYLSWSKSNVKKTSRLCLQYAMWTLAALLSAQFQHLQDFLHHETKQMLESLSLSGDGSQVPFDTEQVQAWILVATYESMRSWHRLAWMSAGRAFRLVQLMRLHEIDLPTRDSISETDLVETEEKRRVFWMAYFLDHLFSMRNNWPITLNEHVICTRLPGPDAEFQSGQPILGNFLSEAIIEASPGTRSSFNECVILATICGRNLFHGQQYNIRCVYEDVTPYWSDQHHWLDSILTNRLQILAQFYPSPTHLCDPMLLFANVMAQATIIYLCKGLESMSWPMDEGRALVIEYQQRALVAAEQIIHLARTLTEFHLFKIHPLMPIPLLLCAEFLYSNRLSHSSFNSRLQDLLDIFRKLKNVNDPSQSYIHLLELSCTPALKPLANES